MSAAMGMLGLARASQGIPRASQASPRRCWRLGESIGPYPRYPDPDPRNPLRRRRLDACHGHSAVEHALRRRHANRLNSSHALVKQLDGAELDDDADEQMAEQTGRGSDCCSCRPLERRFWYDSPPVPSTPVPVPLQASLRQRGPVLARSKCRRLCLSGLVWSGLVWSCSIHLHLHLHLHH
jgi:hypothetical protein